MPHLLVTNDFPPKVGGIQTYLGELWRRLPPGEAVVLTAANAGAAAWDAAQPMPIHRVDAPVLLPQPGLIDRIRRLAADTGATLVVLDPALPLGLVGPRLGLPYAVILHGAEVTVPARMPVSSGLLRQVICGACGIIAAGGYPAAEAVRVAGPGHPLDVARIPPGVDIDRFHPLDADGRRAARDRLGLPGDGPLVLAASRLVPRKGIDVVIEALPSLLAHRPALTLAVAGAGRDARRLRRLAGRLGVARQVRFLGRVPDADLAALYGASDVFAMVCRDRWGGLEQEGFGIVFLEAAASGVPQVAGASGGSAEAVTDGITGFVIDRTRDVDAVAAALARLLDDDPLRARMAEASRQRAESEFSWDGLAGDLAAALRRWAP